mmetsp:Transcript_32049/g.98950  ORF Transcript_32049/g.98950 Transcript_32049/m.98950 type:complete len:176 (-) Transcript_32049:40-567(-)
MAKSIRSKVKKRHRSYMRKEIGEKVRSANIEAATKRLDDKRKGRANTRTLTHVKGALSGRVDLGKAYYDAIVKHAREPDAADASDDDDDGAASMSDDEAGAAPAPAPTPATLEEEAACQLSLRTKQEVAQAKVLLGRGGNGKKIRGGQHGSGVFSKRARRRADASTRPPKEMVAF